MTEIKLSRLLEGVTVLEAPPTDPEVTGLCYDSRRLKAGDCFVAIPGTHTDGHRYVETALRDGAVAAVVARRAGTAWPQVVVPDTRKALAQMSSTWYRHPSRDLVVIGVTGTDGKTTTTTMIQQMLLTAGRPAGSMSTVDIRYGDRVDLNDSRQTTLEALEIQEQLARDGDGGDGTLEHRNHASKLLFRAQAGTCPGLGTGGLTANVDQVGAILLQLSGLADGRLEIDDAVTRKGVGGNVDDPHEVGAGTPVELTPSDAERPQGGRHRPERSIMSFR
ncbi:MAG: hypothetical protein E6I99_06200 [Chloroflexi bacterium]|nr:MAG: hypothetical protein E6I99_06200 [Chloroflexota bacterium]